jgi:hypothetical protein
MPSTKKAWRKVVAAVLGGRDSMKEAKLVKRCAKAARQEPVLSAMSQDEAGDGLRAFLAR